MKTHTEEWGVMATMVLGWESIKGQLSLLPHRELIELDRAFDQVLGLMKKSDPKTFVETMKAASQSVKEELSRRCRDS